MIVKKIFDYNSKLPQYKFKRESWKEWFRYFVSDSYEISELPCGFKKTNYDLLRWGCWYWRVPFNYLFIGLFWAKYKWYDLARWFFKKKLLKVKETDRISKFWFLKLRLWTKK